MNNTEQNLNNGPQFATLHPNLLIGIYRALHLLAKRDINSRGYFEFGLYRGFSFWFANNLAKEMGLDFEFHGFDSFEGLPESKVDIHKNWSEGSYACSLKEVDGAFKKWGMPEPYHLHKGWYSKQLFAEIDQEYKLPDPALAIIDSDLYESAIEVLEFLRPKMSVGMIILFDDFNAFAGDPKHGERRAIREFEISNPTFSKKSLFTFGPYGEAFEITSL